MAGELLRWSGAEASHQLLHVVHARGPGHAEGELRFGMIAELPIQGIELLVQRFSGGFAGGGEFGEQHGGDGGIFVANVGADQIAVRFFAAEDKAIGAGGVDFLADPFETDLQIAVCFDTVLIGDAADHFGGDERFDDVVLRRRGCRLFCGPRERIRPSRAASWLPVKGFQVMRMGNGDWESGEGVKGCGGEGENFSGAAAPRRSQSGSVARIKSAPVCLARSMMISKTAGFSGLETWPGTFGKSPLGSACGPKSSTSLKLVGGKDRQYSRGADAVERGVDNAKG